MQKVDRFISDLIGVEGGYVNDPDDKGGPTKFGITHAVARAFGYKADMMDMPRSVAEAIYKQRYWEQPGFGRIAEHSEAIAVELLDTGVNMGQSVASKFLQRSLNVMNQQGKLYPDLVADGAIGNMTIAALASYLKHRGKPGETVMLRALNALQGARYIEIAESRPQNESFVYGWFSNRVGL